MTDAERIEITGRAVVLYDGVCGLCNRIVQLLLRLDRGGRLRYAPLESSLAAELLRRFPASPAEPEGVVLIVAALTPGTCIFRRFDAVAEALRSLPGPWPALGAVLRRVPRALREWSYGLIARYRYRLFGRYDACPIPTPAQRSRILGIEP